MPVPTTSSADISRWKPPLVEEIDSEIAMLSAKLRRVRRADRITGARKRIDELLDLRLEETLGRDIEIELAAAAYEGESPDWVACYALGWLGGEL